MPIKKIFHRLELRLRALQKVGVKKSSLIGLVTVLGLLVFYLFLVQPLWAKLNRVNNQIQNAKVQYAKFTRLFSSKADYSKRFQEYQDYVIQKRSDDAEQTQFLKQIEQISQELAGRFRVTDTKPRQATKNNFIKTYSVELQVETDDLSLAQFIYRVGTMKELMRVEQYTLAPKERSTGLIDVDLVISKVLVES